MESNWKFQRGDIYFVKLEAGVGSEQNGARPAVILQNDVGNIYSPTLIVAALTSKTDKKVTQATHCQVEEDGLKPSIVQAEQIFTIDKSRVLKFVGHLSPENMRRVDDAVKISLALNPMGSIQKLKPIIRSQAAYAPPEVVDGKPPIYPYTPIKSSFEDAGSVEETKIHWQNCFAPKKSKFCAELRRDGAGMLTHGKTAQRRSPCKICLLRRMFSYAESAKAALLGAKGMLCYGSGISLLSKSVLSSIEVRESPNFLMRERSWSSCCVSRTAKRSSALNSPTM